MPNSDNFLEYRELILAELKRLTGDVGSIREKLDEFRQQDIAELRTDIALLKLKATMWACVFGTLSSALVTGVISAVVKFVH